MSDEWIVQVDENDVLVEKLERDLAHDTSDLKLHREVMTLLYTDASRTQFLLQHRSMKKKKLPGYWTLSVTGHVDFADVTPTDPEGYLTAAKRETYEEIGVSVQNLELVGRIEQKIPENWAMMGLVVGEYRGQLRLDPEEVSDVKVFDKHTLGKISDKLTPGAKVCLEYLNLI